MLLGQNSFLFLRNKENKIKYTTCSLKLHNGQLQTPGPFYFLQIWPLIPSPLLTGDFGDLHAGLTVHCCCWHSLLWFAQTQSILLRLLMLLAPILLSARPRPLNSWPSTKDCTLSTVSSPNFFLSDSRLCISGYAGKSTPEMCWPCWDLQ